MDVLLTGAGGYVGSRVGALLTAQGISWRGLEGRLEELPPRSLEAASVIHCAGALRRRETHRPGALEAANVEGTRRLCAGLCRPTRIVFVSSRSVYGLNGHQLVDEETSPAPFDAYGRSKLAAERVLRDSPHQVAVVRAAGVFGHPERPGIFLDHALDRAIAGRAIPLAEPDRLEDYVPVNWLAEVLAAAAITGKADGQVLHAAGPARSLHGVVAALGRAIEAGLGRRVALEPVQLPVPETVLLGGGALQACLALRPVPEDEAVFAAMIAGRARAGLPPGSEPAP
jgi:nucleoside-diphosphate-sugar epimerase